MCIGWPAGVMLSAFCDPRQRGEQEQMKWAMMRQAGWWLLGTLGLGVVCQPASVHAQMAPVKPEQVNSAIQRGIDFLRSRQLGDGSWPVGAQIPEGGVTPLVTLAMLSCEVPADDPRLVKSLELVRNIPRDHVYNVSLQTMVLALAEPKKSFATIQENVDYLQRIRRKNGSWGYNAARGSGDNSNTQYALLALDAAQNIGIEIDKEFWEGCRNYWVEMQNRNIGSWGYPERGATASMTVAGISSLIIASRHLPTVQAGVVDGRAVRCNGPIIDKELDLAFGWLSRNFSVSSNINGEQLWLYYYLYGLERAGRLSGRRFFGTHDWYRAGARFLVDKQKPNGGWSQGTIGLEFENVDTAFALLFLSKGKIPILINKLKHEPAEDWNNSPNDIYHLTDYVSELWQRPLNWQTVDMRVNPNATVEELVADLLQAPILHISGHYPPRLTPKEVEVLQRYVEQGGLILADANCSARPFDAGFRELCRTMFPDQPLRRIEPGHPVWTEPFNLSPDWPLYGVDVGCRIGIFYSPEDLSCRWEHKAEGDSAFAFRLGANIVSYAVGPSDLKDKLELREVDPDDQDDPIRRGFLQIAKIKHNGDWNLAPNAVRRLMSSLHDVAKMDVIRQQREMDIGTNLFNYPLAYMHGRNAFRFTPREIQLLRDYLANGGTLFADACCGSPAFDKAFRQFVVELYPELKLESIPPEHEIFTTDIGYDITNVNYTEAMAQERGATTGKPLLEGVAIDDRYIIVYSPYDIGCALEKQKSRSCKGYPHEEAVRIASNVVLYALQQ